MLLIILGLFLVLFFLLAGWTLKIPVFSPLILNSVGWMATFASGVYFHKEYFPITAEVFIAWMIWFLIVSIIFIFLSTSSKSSVIIGSVLQQHSVRVRYDWVILFFCIMLVWRIWVVGSTGPEHFFLNLRLASVGIEGFGALGGVARFYPVVFALFIVEWILLSNGRRLIRYLLLFWMVLYAIGTMGKFAFLTPLLIVAFSLTLHHKIQLKKLLFLGIITLLIMVALHFIRSGSFSIDEIGHFFSVYTYSPIVALGYLEPSQTVIFGENTFRFYYAVAHALGASTPPAEVILSYVNIPSLTNVYTGLFPYYQDFGLAGVFFAAVFWGVFFGSIYYLSMRGSITLTFIHASLLVVSICVFFHDLFFMGLSGHIHVFIMIIMVRCLMVRKNNG